MRARTLSQLVTLLVAPVVLLACSTTDPVTTATTGLPSPDVAASTTIADSGLCDRLPELDDEEKRSTLENDPEHPHEAVARLAGSLSSCFLRYRSSSAVAEVALIRYGTVEQAVAARDALVSDWEMQIKNQPAVAKDGTPTITSRDGGVVKSYGTSTQLLISDGEYFVLILATNPTFAETIIDGLSPYISTR